MGTGRSYPGGKAAGAWSWQLTSNYCRGQENVNLYIHSPISLHGVVLNYSSQAQGQLYFYLYSYNLNILIHGFTKSLNANEVKLTDMICTFTIASEWGWRLAPVKPTTQQKIYGHWVRILVLSVLYELHVIYCMLYVHHIGKEDKRVFPPLSATDLLILKLFNHVSSTENVIRN
jgi:hypothetical protein